MNGRAYTQFSTRQTAQSESIPGDEQVQNNAGGYAYQLDDWTAFERFLILGTEGGSYYVTEKKLTKENALRTMKVIAEDGLKAVDMIVKVSDNGLAPKNDPAIFALALAASAADPATRVAALSALPRVCRIPTHLFHFLTYVKQFRGFGRGLKHAVARWYNDMPVEKLAYEVVKYQQRDGWSNADMLRLSHPKTSDTSRNMLYKWIVDGYGEVLKLEEADGWREAFPRISTGFEDAKRNDNSLLYLIKEFNLSREMVPTEALTHPDVWEALLQKMPFTAMIRNLGNMSKVGLLKPLSDASKLIVERLHDQEAIRKARIHPVAVLIAMKTYSNGHGVKGSGEWTPVPAVTAALDDAFYLAFKSLEPTGKRLLFGVDVSGSMGSPCGGLPITCAEGAAAMALACAKSEHEYYIMGFAHEFIDLGITSRMTLNEALTKTRDGNFGMTDCALPMLWAQHQKVKVDAFIVITDNETWAGSVHPSQALTMYRQWSGLPAKQVVIGMTASNFSIAQPDDPLALDVCGFDTSVPQAIGAFLK